MSTLDEFDHASKCFTLMNLTERLRALEAFQRCRGKVADRFVKAVLKTIRKPAGH